MVEPVTPTGRRAAIYQRVSSDEQRENETIKTQTDAIKRFLANQRDVQVVGWYSDDGISGTIALRQRPAGRRLIEDAFAGKFDILIVTRADRLGRDTIDMMQTYQLLGSLGIEVVGAVEALDTEIGFDINVLMAKYERRRFLTRSREGMLRAAREGRYTGGIVPYGYFVKGEKPHARLAIDNTVVFGERTAADVIRWIFDLIGRAGRNCYYVADLFNVLGVPTAYTKDERLVGKKSRGQRKERTSGEWRPSRIRQLIHETIYRGILQYGRRSTGIGPDGRPLPMEVIEAPCPALVSQELWDAAQETVAKARLGSFTSTHRRYLLKAKITCGNCGLQYAGFHQKLNGTTYYKCGGKTAYRGPFKGACPNANLTEHDIEPLVLDDITRFLSEPGVLLDELAAECRMSVLEAVAASERVLLSSRIDELDRLRKRLLQLLTNETITEAEFKEQAAAITNDRRVAQDRLDRLAPELEPKRAAERLPADLLAELRTRVLQGLSEDEKFELVGLLVEKLIVHLVPVEGKRPNARVEIHYRFGDLAAESCVVPIYTGTD